MARLRVVLTLALTVLAFSPALAFAESAPTVESLTVREGGSNGGTKLKIIGTEFTGATANGDVRFAKTELKHVTGTIAKSDFKVLGNTEIEADSPFHVHGKVPVTVCNPAGCSGSPFEPPTAEDEFTYLDEIYRQEIATAVGSHIPAIGYGQIELESPQIQTTVECVNLGLERGLERSVHELAARSRGTAKSSSGGQMATRRRRNTPNSAAAAASSTTAWKRTSRPRPLPGPRRNRR